MLKTCTTESKQVTQISLSSCRLRCCQHANPAGCQSCVHAEQVRLLLSCTFAVIVAQLGKAFAADSAVGPKHLLLLQLC